MNRTLCIMNSVSSIDFCSRIAKIVVRMRGRMRGLCPLCPYSRPRTKEKEMKNFYELRKFVGEIYGGTRFYFKSKIYSITPYIHTVPGSH